MSPDTLSSLPEPFQQAIKLIDEAHAQDPNLIDSPDGPKTLPYELHYARKMTRWLAMHTPDAPAVLQVACRAQHFRRWELPRSSFPMTRPGYLLWRSKQKSQAAAQVSDLIKPLFASSSSPEDDVARIAALIRKENLSSDPEAQALEDVACLVFLDDQFDGFESKPEIDEEKMVGILRKTWGKMGERGKELALGMDLSERAQLLIGKALAPGT
ncbi:glutamyl-tRNA synthetase [Sarocladium implicatum]|nr:glutamyl-tRNA synthetase [Sarocladium implicatum]